jgi:hypothetical protein
MRHWYVTAASVVLTGIAAYALGVSRHHEQTSRSPEARFRSRSVLLLTGTMGEVQQISHFVRAEGVQIRPLLKTLSQEDLSRILAAVSKIKDGEPVLSIEILSTTRVEVRTGKVRGPLDGGGMVYRLDLIDDSWKIDDKATTHWMT